MTRILDEPMFTAGPRSVFRQLLFYWVPVLLYVSVIFYVSSLSNPPAPLHFKFADKLYHLGEYGVLGLLLGRAIRRSASPYSMLAAAVMTVSLVMLIGAADEYYQSFVPGRDSSPYDWATDSAAAALSQLVLARFMRPRRKAAR